MTDRIAIRLAELGYRPMDFVFSIVEPMENYADFVASWSQCELPADYRAFLDANSASGSFDIPVAFAGIEQSPWASSGKESLALLFGRGANMSTDLVMVNEGHRAGREIPFPHLVIGAVSTVNLLVIGLCEERFGQIFVWVHDHPMDDPRQGLYLVARSFTEFVELLVVEASSDVDEETYEIGDGHFNDEFMQKVAQYKAMLAQRKRPN